MSEPPAKFLFVRSNNIITSSTCWELILTSIYQISLKTFPPVPLFSEPLKKNQRINRLLDRNSDLLHLHAPFGTTRLQQQAGHVLLRSLRLSRASAGPFCWALERFKRRLWQSQGQKNRLHILTTLYNNGINYQPQLVIVGILVAINRMKRLRLSIPLWMAGFVTASRTSSLLFFWLFNSVCCFTLCMSQQYQVFFFQCPPDPWRIQIVPGEALSYCSQARTSQIFLSDSIVLIPYHVWYSIFTYIYHKNQPFM